MVQRLHPNLLLSARRFSVALNAMAIPVDEVPTLGDVVDMPDFFWTIMDILVNMKFKDGVFSCRSVRAFCSSLRPFWHPRAPKRRADLVETS